MPRVSEEHSAHPQGLARSLRTDAEAERARDAHQERLDNVAGKAGLQVLQELVELLWAFWSGNSNWHDGRESAQWESHGADMAAIFLPRRRSSTSGSPALS